MKALVTGSSGFCGRHLSAYLVGQGLDVSTLAPRPGGKNHYQIRDVNDRSGITEVFASLRPDFVFHLAGANPGADPFSTYQVNTVYALALLQALELADLKACVLLAGSAAEYGLVPETHLPISEDFPCVPYSYYGISKLAQTLTGLLVAKKGRPVVVVRAFNILGPGMPDRLVVGSLAKQVDQIVKGKRPAVVEIGNAHTSRDFIDVAELLPIYWKLIRSPNAYGEIVNVCTGVPIPVGNLLEQMIKLSGMDMQVVSRTERQRKIDPLKSYGSTEKLQSLIGYVPRLEPDRSLGLILEHLAKET
jgi:GDP-4-dehydro-6-deoxy-D-mannose reductase